MESLPPDLSQWLIRSAGAALGIPAGVVFLLLAAQWLKSQYDFLVNVKRGARRAASFSRTVLHIGPVGIVVRFSFTVLVLLAQALVVFMCYIAGNYLSILFDSTRQRTLELLFSRDGWHTLTHLETLQKVLVTDRISGGYAALAIFVIVMSYAGVGWAEPASYLIGGPGWIMLGLAYVSGVFLLMILVFIVLLWLMILLFTGKGPAGSDVLDFVDIGLQYLLPAATAALFAFSSRWAVVAAGGVREAWGLKNTA